MPEKLMGSTEPRIFTPPLRPVWPRTPETEQNTDGYRLIDFAEHVLGMPLLPWQQWLAAHALERREDGSLRFRNIVVEVARQNGKSLFSGVLALYTLYLSPRRLVLGTSATLPSAEEQWTETLEILKDVDALKAELVKEDYTNGQKAFKVANQSRYLVRATNRKATRGLSVDCVLMDELRECDWAGWGAATKTTPARPDGQVWSLSNAGDEQSIVLKHLRLVAHKMLGDPDGIVKAANEGLQDEEAEEIEPDDSMAWYEWSADPRLPNGDRRAWAQANPGLGRTITEATLAGFYATDPEHVFSTESLCKWVLAAGTSVFPAGAWERGVDSDSRIAMDSELAFGVDMSADRAVTHIAVAGHRPDGGTHVEVIASRAGVIWLPQWFRERLEDGRYREMRVALQERGAPISDQIEALEDVPGLEVIPWGGQDLGQGSGQFYDAVCSVAPERMVKHVPDDRIDRAAAQALPKSLGDVWIWDRKKSPIDVAPMMAINAAYWLLHRKPEKKFRSAYEDGGLMVV